MPPLLEQDIELLSIGKKIVFSEIEEEEEYNRIGLKNYIYHYENDKHIFIFDNHNHAYFFWMLGYLNGVIDSGKLLIHIDQHTDMREPEHYFPERLDKSVSLKEIFKYTNYTLNVGSFIRPALNCGLFSDVKIIDSSWAFAWEIPDNFVLDIDMDIFSEDMDYIKDEIKQRKIKDYIAQTDFITIATSPYFIEQEKAIKLIKQLFH